MCLHLVFLEKKNILPSAGLSFPQIAQVLMRIKCWKESKVKVSCIKVLTFDLLHSSKQDDVGIKCEIQTCSSVCH